MSPSAAAEKQFQDEVRKELDKLAAADFRFGQIPLDREPMSTVYHRECDADLIKELRLGTDNPLYPELPLVFVEALPAHAMSIPRIYEGALVRQLGPDNVQSERGHRFLGEDLQHGSGTRNRRVVQGTALHQ